MPPQEGNFHPTNTPMGLYPTADGFLNLAATSNKNFQKFLQADRPREDGDDPGALPSPALRGRNKEGAERIDRDALRAKTSGRMV